MIKSIVFWEVSNNMYFKLKIDNIKENLQYNNDYYKKVKDINNNIYQNIYNLRNSWDDLNTNNFISKVKTNAINIDSYIDELKKDDGYLLDFISTINNICSNYDINNVSTITFDNSSLDTILVYLDNVVNNMNNIIRTANKIDALDGSFNYNSYYNISKATNIKNAVLSLKSEIENFSKSINNAFIDFESTIKKHKINFDISKIETNIKTVSIDKNRNNDLINQNVNGVNLRDIIYEDK